MADELLVLPPDAALDPLDPASIRDWVARVGPAAAPSRSIDGARSLVELVHRLWPGLTQRDEAGAVILSADEAPFEVVVAENYARLSILRGPKGDEPPFGETIGRAISCERGWVGYDPRREEIVEGLRWHCAACDSDYDVRHMACPRCSTPPSRDAHSWAEAEPLFGPSYSTPRLSLLPLLWHYGLDEADLTDDVVARIEQALADTVGAYGDGTPLEVFVEREDSSVQVLQCLTVVQTVGDPASEIPVDSVPARSAEGEVGDDLLFMLYIAHGDQELARYGDQELLSSLPFPPCQPGLAGPMWATLRPLLTQLAQAQ